MKITREELRDAVDKNGFPLERGSFALCNNKGDIACACAITHLFALEHADKIVEGRYETGYFQINYGLIQTWAVEKYGYMYTEGVIDGFDGGMKTSIDNSEYLEGYENGKLLRLEIPNYIPEGQ